MRSRGRSQAELENLVDETGALRRERDKLRRRNHVLKHPAEQWQRGSDASHGSGAAERATDGAQAPPPADQVPTLAADELLAAMDARLESCVAEVVIAGHPTPAEREVLRAIRSRAAVVTLQCIGLMLRCACAVLPSPTSTRMPCVDKSSNAPTSA